MGDVVVAPPASLNVGLFGTNPEILRLLGAGLGKKGTESDLRFWNRKERDLAVTAIAPIPFPERIVPMLQVASLCDYPVLVANALDAPLGEMVLALAATRKPGLVIVTDPEIAERVHRIVRERLRGWVTMEWSGEESVRRVRDLLPGVSVPRETGGPCTVVLDHAFDARGVGTVALGFVRRGILRVHEELTLLPLDRTVAVRSIQRFDEDQAEAAAGSRVGVALRDVEAHEIERGSLLTSDLTILARPVLEVRPFARSEFSRDPLGSGTRGFHLLCGTYVRPVVVNEAGPSLWVTADSPVPAVPGELSFLVSLRGPGTLRIAGHGPLAP